jgi:hypothetical protein
MAEENPSWGEGPIADELSLKLGILVNARTVGKYMKQSGRSRGDKQHELDQFHNADLNLSLRE